MAPDKVENMTYRLLEAAKLGASSDEKMRVTLKSNADYFMSYSEMMSKGDTRAA